MEKMVKQFMRAYKFEEDERLLGVILYENKNYNTVNESDINLLLISNKNNDYRGICYLEGLQIGYFEKSLSSVYESIANREEIKDELLIKILEEGKVIDDRKQIIQYIRKLIKEKNKNPNTNEEINIDKYYQMFKKANDEDFRQYLYYNLVEEIRKKYQIIREKEEDEKKRIKQDKKFQKVIVNLIRQGINEEEIEKLREILDNKQVGENKSNRNNTQDKNKLIYDSVVVNSYINKIKEYSKKYKNREYNENEYRYLYSLILESIRKLYCSSRKIDSDIEVFGCEYEERFLELFNKCLKNKDICSLEELFKDVSLEFDICYNNHKILKLY